jgi:hypothetical protein
MNIFLCKECLDIIDLSAYSNSHGFHSHTYGRLKLPCMRWALKMAWDALWYGRRILKVDGRLRIAAMLIHNKAQFI